MGAFLITLGTLLIIFNLTVLLCQDIYNFIVSIKLNKRRNKLEQLMEETLEKMKRDIENKEE